MQLLRPPQLKLSYYSPIQKEIERIWYEAIYKKLFSTIPKELQNSVDDSLYTAIKNGEIWYQNGALHGSFSASTALIIIEIGGKFNKKSKTYSLKKLPLDYESAGVIARNKYSQIKLSMINVLDDVTIDDDFDISNISDIYQDSIKKMDSDFIKVARKFAIAPELTQETINTLSADWAYNLDLYIKNWSSENIIKMRNEISSNIFGGQRASNLAKVIQTNYSQSKNKAKFLARQETALLISKYHENKYKSLGITKYIWETSGDERVREDHTRLNGKVFSWDKPPVVDMKSGRRANPREDFGCRCVAIAVID